MNVVANIDLRKKAKKGIDQADDITVKMILAILEVRENETEEEVSAERILLQRFKDYEQGKVKSIKIDELESKARQLHLDRKRAKK